MSDPKPLEVIGYESGASPDYPLVWGAAAIRDEKGVHNAVLDPEAKGFGIDNEEWESLIRKGSVTKMEVAVPVEGPGPFFVVDLRIDLLDREPYQLHGGAEFNAVHPGVVAVGRGETRGYYIFQSHDHVESWLYHLHATKFLLTPV